MGVQDTSVCYDASRGGTIVTDEFDFSWEFLEQKGNKLLKNLRANRFKV